MRAEDCCWGVNYVKMTLETGSWSSADVLLRNICMPFKQEEQEADTVWVYTQFGEMALISCECLPGRTPFSNKDTLWLFVLPVILYTF